MAFEAVLATDVRSPLTGGPGVTRQAVISTDDLAKRWESEYGIDVEPELHGLAAVNLYRCNATGLLFFRPADVAGSASLYSQLQRSKPYYSNSLAWENFRALEDMQAGWRALEIGCGTGLFVAKAREAGVDMRGIELNPDAVATAQSRGLPVEVLDLDVLVNTHVGRFDCVCCFQVLEHVPEPGMFLRHCLSLLRPGGVLIIAVPNAEGMLRGADEILDCPPHHMSRWSPRAFGSLEQSHGARIRRCLWEPLAAEHVNQYLAYHGDALARRVYLPSKIVKPLAALALRGGFRKLVKGHALYACLVRMDARG